MTKDNGKLNRREFIATTAVAGALAHPTIKALAKDETFPDLAVANGSDEIANTKAALAAFGGIKSFVKPGQTVAILPNAQGTHPGCSTNINIVKTVVDLCKEAGATEVRWLTWLPKRTWARSKLEENVAFSGAKMIFIPGEDDQLWEEFEVTRGKALKKVRVFKALFEADVFISMPIVKDHIGSRFTGSLKNYMGTSHPLDNRPFHPTFEGENLTHMEHCIADLNTVVRAPDLIVMDAMEILTTNGPFGPGEITKPQKVIVGKDRVAIDCYAATTLGLEGKNVAMIANAYAHGLGEIDLAKVKIEQLEIG
jgi:uncharacterized protein (DUF362 family)